MRPASEQGSDEGQSQAIDTEQIALDYRHLYWTRLMVLADYEADQERKCPLGTDIIDEC